MATKLATKLTLHSLYTSLRWGVSPNQQQISSALEQLQKWQNQPGYYSLLQTIVGDMSLAFDIRWLAAIQLKNGVDRYWRKTSVHAIGKEEKDLIRSRSIQFAIAEPDQRMALQNSLFVAKIIRVDLSHDWPDAVATAVQAVVNSSQDPALQVQLLRSLLLLLTIVKELSTVRLISTRKSLYAVAPSILQSVGHIYVGYMASWKSTLAQSGDHDQLLREMECSLLCLRLLRRLIVAGYEEPGREEQVRMFWTTLTVHFQYLLSILKHNGNTLLSQACDLLEKHALQLGKLHIAMVEVHPASFPELPDAIEIGRAYWNLLVDYGQVFGVQYTQEEATKIGVDGDAEDKVPFMEKLSLKGLLLLRGCIKTVYNPTMTFKYQNMQEKLDRKTSKAIMKEGLLSEDLVCEMMETLVTRFFVFRSSDLRRWEEEPDEWERQEEGEGESWKYSVRVCAEKLFLDLVLHHKDILVQPLLNYFMAVATPRNEDVFLKDSIYGAIGLSAPVLVGKFDFNAFMASTLIHEIQKQHHTYRILRRRAAIMLGQWVPLGHLDPSLVYLIFEYLLDPSDPLNDLVVRVTAGRQLKNSIDPYEQSADIFAGFGHTIMTRLLSMVDEVELTDTKMALLYTVQSLIGVMEQQIVPYADQIVDRLPKIWAAAGDEYLLKQKILGLLSDLFKAMKADSARYHSLVVPLISSALDLANESRLYLLDEAVFLWASLLTEAPEAIPEITDLLPNLLPLFETADENLRTAIEITGSYVLLAPDTMLGEHATAIWRALAAMLMAPLKKDATIAVCEVVERVLKVAYSLGGAGGVGHIAHIMDGAGITSAILGGLIDAFRAHQDPSPRAPKTNIDGVLETNYWCIAARIMIGSPTVFLQMLESWSNKGGPADTVHILIDLLTELFSHYESVGSATCSKLLALALAALFGHNDSKLQQKLGDRLQEIITVWTAAIHECTYEGKDTLMWENMEALKPTGGDAAETLEERRKRELEFRDPLRLVDIRDAVRQSITAFTQALGSPETFSEFTQNVDKDVLKQFEALHLFA